jgi:L-alanine-DL-glutamate epimerase-like enolase superfamily enzyme
MTAPLHDDPGPLSRPAGMNRRTFVRQAALAGGGALLSGSLPSRALGAPAFRMGGEDLRITRIILQDARGRRATPVAPNAYAAYRGYLVREPLVRVLTNQGIEGVTRSFNAADRTDVLRQLIGLNPFDLFQWRDDRYAGPAEAHRTLVESLGSFDIALFDLMGKATRRPVADLLGPRLRASVHVYDSTLYMDDLLTPQERVGLAYLRGGPPPADDAGMVARKARWLVDDFYRDEGVRIFKIKTGRARWMESPAVALQRDVDVFRGVRDAVGPHYTLFVDVNNGYDDDPAAAKRFIEETSDTMLFGMEEMFREHRVDEHREVVEHADSLGLRVRNIDGEAGGIPPQILAETVATPLGTRPLFDINNPSYSHGSGFVETLRQGRHSATLGVDIAPHNFASKVGFYASVHTGFVLPNFAFAEIDDSAFPALRLVGIEIRNGRATLTGAPGLGIEIDPHGLEAPDLEIA